LSLLACGPDLRQEIIMQIEMHKHNGVQIVEVAAPDVALRTPQDVLDLFGNFFPEHVDGVILTEANLPPEFFDLRTRLAGEMLQKFVNYGVKLAIVGDFSKYASKALADFIRESNRGRQLYFVATRQEALERLAPVSS
jgi:hypothetical protein